MEEIRGLGVALVTPFDKNGAIEYGQLSKVVNHVSEGDVDYLVVMGTTAENPTLSWQEQLEVLEFILQENKRDLPIVFGHGGNNTQLLIDRFVDLKSFPITALLSVSPYYNRPSPEGLLSHYRKLADHSEKPIILYDVPKRTGQEIDIEVVVELSKHENIIAIKDSVGNYDRVQSIIRNKDKSFEVISGDDSTASSIIKMGGIGLVSVLANLLPGDVSELIKSLLESQEDRSMLIEDRLTPFYELILTEGNPTSIKAGMSVAGICNDYTRLPLVAGSQGLKERYSQCLKSIKKGT